MDFIERWFGISPDGGNGLTEVSYILLLALVIVLLLRQKIFSQQPGLKDEEPHPAQIN